jgi:hypothetical protein
MTLFKPQYFVLLEGSEEDSESGLTPFGRWALPEWLLIGQLDNYSNGPVFTRAGRSRFGLRARQGKAGQGKASHSRHSFCADGLELGGPLLQKEQGSCGASISTWRAYEIVCKSDVLVVLYLYSVANEEPRDFLKGAQSRL